MVRIRSISAVVDQESPDYTARLRSAVAAAIDYGIAALRHRDVRPAPVPAELISQARRAANTGLPLDIVLRRYIAGQALLEDFLIQEAETIGDVGVGDLKVVLRIEAMALDHLIAAVTIEYESEAEARSRSRSGHRRMVTEALLTGKPCDEEALGYDLDAWHIALIATGRGASALLRGFAAALNRSLLTVPQGEETIWGWLGGPKRLDDEGERCLIALGAQPQIRVAIGESSDGLDGWRLSHFQARAALPIMRKRRPGVTRYTDVALAASMLGDEVLARTLTDHFLGPLAAERDGGYKLKETLRAYFAADRSISSAAVALDVSRHTVSSRLQATERRLGRPLRSCTPEMEAALRLESLS